MNPEAIDFQEYELDTEIVESKCPSSLFYTQNIDFFKEKALAADSTYW